jgi:Domain of unknown function (DUF4157)
MRTFAKRPKATQQIASAKAPLVQAKPRVNTQRDIYEEEADRIADQVRAASEHPAKSGTLPSIQRIAGAATSTADPVPASVGGVIASPGRPLEPALQQDMGQRFGHDFSMVRVHSGTTAEQSAREVSAHAYTVGHDIVFGAGQFAPETREGGRLIAHELTHVVQQSGAKRIVSQSNGKRGSSPLSLPMVIQREPDKSQPKQDPQKTQPANKTLASDGVGLDDPVAGGTATIIDEVLLRNQRLAPYIGDRLKGGFKIAEKGKFVHDSSDGNFENAYRNTYGLNPSDPIPTQTSGFFDPKKSEVHLRPGAKFGTALHESVHRLASPGLYTSYLTMANKISTNLVEVLSEGVTAFFTDCILRDEGLPNFNDAYRSKKTKVETLIKALGPDGFDLMAKFNFQAGAIMEIGEKLGFTREQFGAARGRGIEEVLKKMESAM